VDVLAPLIVIVVLTVIVLLVSAPLRGGASARAEERAEVRRADLEAAREAKYHEIRDAELDYRTGKMSQADWRRLDRELRAEAIEILRALDELPPAPTENGTRRAADAPAAAGERAPKAKPASTDKRAPQAARAAKERPAAKEPAPAPRRRKPARRK
jgi:hypothetical protein